jgi:hypothetical protein
LTQASDGVFDFAPARLRIYQALISVISCVTVGGIVGFAVDGFARYVILTIAALATVVAARRAFRLRLSLSHRDVTIQNYWRAHRFPWEVVTDVGMALKTMGIVPQPAIHFLFVDGRSARAQATPSRLQDQRRLFEVVATFAPDHVRIHEP